LRLISCTPRVGKGQSKKLSGETHIIKGKWDTIKELDTVERKGVEGHIVRNIEHISTGEELLAP
jgi:hypothetical protein